MIGKYKLFPWDSETTLNNTAIGKYAICLPTMFSLWTISATFTQLVNDASFGLLI